MYTAITDFERPDPALIARAAKTYFLFLAAAAGPRQVMDSGIKPLVREWKICGPAFTARAEHAEDVVTSYAANFYAKPGDVIVVDAAGRTDVACYGASMARGAKQAGAVGVVIDGCCESSNVIIDREKMPLFVRGTSPNIIPQERPGWLNCPVICGRVIVNPGDIVCGDADGVVVVPKVRAEEIIRSAEERGARYQGPNSIVNMPFRQSHADPVARYHKMPGITWR